MVRIANAHQNFINPTSDQLELCSNQDIQTSPVCYTCILTDLTDPLNSCRRHAITLSNTYSVESLIKEAASYFSYEADSFILMWKRNNELLNISEIQSSTLADLGLSVTSKNIFEIHEKEGPPKRLKIDDFDYNSTSNIYQSSPFFGIEEEWKVPNLIETYPPTRRNACSNVTYSPTNNSLPSFTLFEDDNNGYVGLINQAMTCYLNSLIQTLFMTPEFRNGIYRWNHNEFLNENEDLQKNIPYQLQRLFLNLQTSKKKSIQTHDLTKSFGWNSDDAFQQHDVQELYRVMFDALEKKMKKTRQENMINELYQGKIKDYVKCLECNTESARVDVYLDVPLCIRPFGSDKTFESVEEALDAFIQPEILDENNKYFCEKCKQKCKAHKGLKFESFPYILSLQLKRFDFDYTTLSRFKIGSTVSFPEKLNVAKYLPENNNDQNELYDYELFSIMIHSGSASGGHYYAYIKSFDNNQWYNFNDEKVTKIDHTDIIKAFGTSYSVYSSTTAYMLQYRQINPKINEKVMKIEEFDEHLKQILNKEINDQLEAERLRQYMENMCKIKVILGEQDLRCDKMVDIHKDLTLKQAKEQLIKEFNLEQYLNENKKKIRILKFDSYNDMIEQSYKDENITVFEALGYAKNPFNVNWYLEIINEDDYYVEYNPSDISIKVFSVNMNLFEINELFSLRLGCNSIVKDLRDLIAQKLTCDKERVRMALEKMHTIYKYIYLNKHLEECVQDVDFTRVNKVFIEYEDEKDALKSFEYSKFYYSLDTLINMLNISVYLPNDEQCELFIKKSKRHSEYLKLKRSESQTDQIIMNDDSATIDSCDTITSEQTLSSILAESANTENRISPTIKDTKKMDFIDYYFKSDDEAKKGAEMETSLDEGIGGSNGSLSTNNINSKNSSNDLNWYEIKIRPNSNESDLNGIKDDTEICLEPSCDDLEDLDVNVDDNDLNNLDDDLDDHNIDYGTNKENESLSSLSSSISLIHKLENDNLNELGCNKIMQRVKFSDVDKVINNVKINEPTQSNSDVNEELLEDIEKELDSLPKYSDLEKENFILNNVSETTITNKNNDLKNELNNNMKDKKELLKVLTINKRFVKSILNENKELGTKILEVKMDKRIDLTDFKSHVEEYIKIGLENFRVFRICQDDLECELTTNENNFVYNSQNTKFLIKLGPALKYGEYSIPIFKLNKGTKKNKASFSYLCDFMLYNGLSILDHKKLLTDDLRDLFDIHASVETIRLRKKIAKRPGNILLNHEIIGNDIFINSSSDLCVEILDEPDKKSTKLQTSVYLRHWRPDEYDLGEIEEVILNGNTLDLLIDHISQKSGIERDNIEVLKCLRDFPFKSPILNLHKNQSWKEDSYLTMEKLEDGVCFYYRNKTLRLAELSNEKRKELEKEDNLISRPPHSISQNKKEIGIKIHVENT